VPRGPKQTRSLDALWIVVLAALGAASGYGVSYRNGRPRVEMAIIGAIWGAFLGILVYLDISAVRIRFRRLVGAVAGAGTGCTSGLISGFSGTAILIISIFAATIGYFGDRWVKYITVPL